MKACRSMRRKRAMFRSSSARISARDLIERYDAHAPRYTGRVADVLSQAENVESGRQRDLGIVF